MHVEVTTDDDTTDITLADRVSPSASSSPIVELHSSAPTWKATMTRDISRGQVDQTEGKRRKKQTLRRREEDQRLVG